MFVLSLSLFFLCFVSSIVCVYPLPQFVFDIRFAKRLFCYFTLRRCVYTVVMLIFVATSHQTRLDTRSKARRPIKVGIKGGGGRERTETWTLLVYATHWLTWCNVSPIRQAVSRTQMWVRARMPVYGLNETRGLVPYMGYKGDKTAVRPPEGSLVETRCLKRPKSAIVPFAEPRSGPKSKTGSGVVLLRESHFGIMAELSFRIKRVRTLLKILRSFSD